MADDVEGATQFPDLLEIAKAILAERFSIENIGKESKSFQVAFTEAIKIVFSGISIALSEGIGPIAEGIVRGQQTSEPAFRGVAAAVLSGMFNTPIGAGDVSMFGRGSSARAGTQIADAVFRGISGATGPVAPSAEPAKKFVADGVTRTVEGWATGFVFEILTQIVSFGWVQPEQFAEIANLLQDQLGMDRLTSRVLRPYVDATVVKPFEWHINRTYTPTLLTPAEAATQYYRGRWTREAAVEEMARQGFSSDRIEAKLNAARKTVSVSDLLWLHGEGGYTREYVTQRLRDIGYEDPEIDLLIDVEKTRRHRAIIERQAATTMAGYVDRTIDRAGLLSVLSVAYPEDAERQLLLDLVDLQRAARTKRLSKSDIEDAVKRNILSVVDYRRWLDDEGYSTDAAATLELMLRAEIGDRAEQDRRREQIERDKAAAAAVKAAADAAKQRALEAKALATKTPLADIKRAVVLGLVGLDRYDAALTALEYPSTDRAFLLAMVQADRDKQLATEAARAAAALDATSRGLSLADLDRAVVGGILSVDEYGAQLRQAGFDAAAIDVLTALVAQKRSQRAEADARRTQVAAATATRTISLSQAERAVRTGHWSLDDYRAYLRDQGFGDLDVGLLAELLRGQLDDEREAETRRTVVTDELAGQGISLGQVEQAVIRGLAPIDTYRQLLAQKRYPLTDQQLLVGLLQSKADDAAAARAKQDQVAEETAGRRISLGQIERAVKLGVVTLDAYREYLDDAGYTGADVDVLLGNLVADLQAARQHEQAREDLYASPTVDRASLVEIEENVLDGVATLDDYARVLRSRGFAAADVDLLVALLYDRMVADADAESLEMQVDAELAKKSLSLTQWREAVLGGVRTLSDYAAFLQAQGYSLADVQVLVTLLSRDLDAANAATSEGQ